MEQEMLCCFPHFEPKRPIWRSAKNVLIQKLVPELTFGVKPFAEFNEFRHFLMYSLEFAGRSRKQLPPVWTGIEWSQFPFDDWQQLADCGPVGLPCEVYGHTISFVTGTHPKLVGCDGSNLGDEQCRSDLVVQPFDSQDCLDRVLSRDEIFCLQFLACARRETHAEVRQALVPRARDAHLFGAILGRQLLYRMEIARGQPGSEQFRTGVRRLPWFDAALDPNLVDPLFLPVRKQAYAVSTRFDRI